MYTYMYEWRMVSTWVSRGLITNTLRRSLEPDIADRMASPVKLASSNIRAELRTDCLACASSLNILKTWESPFYNIITHAHNYKILRLKNLATKQKESLLLHTALPSNSALSLASVTLFWFLKKYLSKLCFNDSASSVTCSTFLH